MIEVFRVHWAGRDLIFAIEEGSPFVVLNLPGEVGVPLLEYRQRYRCFGPECKRSVEPSIFC